MRARNLIIVGAVALAGLAGCGSSGHPPAPAGKTHAPTATATRGSATNAASRAAGNERALVDALAGSVITVNPALVAGPVMTDYVTFEQELAEALAASGNPNPADTVTPVAGGYQACQPSGTCDTFTAFTTNGAGQVTGVSVNGRPVAGRVAAGVSSSGSGLQVTGVLAYLLTDEQELTAVCFQLHDVSYQPVNNNPSVLANFSTPSGQVAVDNDYIVLLPSLLSPGTTASTCTIFATSEVTGTLDLVPNDQTGTVLVSATLTEP